MAQPQDQKLKSNFKWQAALSKIEKIEETPPEDCPPAELYALLSKSFIS